ncbi:hypothetical protein J6590_079244 [Homalodisca vitripennis]|nr:hypothetical protein J6590_079244 [Homalodisca vitripennis]
MWYILITSIGVLTLICNLRVYLGGHCGSLQDQCTMMDTLGHGWTSVPRLLLWVMEGPLCHKCNCGSWQDLCTGMANVGHGRSGVPDYCGAWQDLCTGMATVGHGRTSVPNYCGSWQDLCTYAVTLIRRI